MRGTSNAPDTHWVAAAAAGTPLALRALQDALDAGLTMDEVDLAAELMEIEAELKRRERERAGEPARLFDVCRDCDEPLTDPVLRAAGFCDRYCRDRFELAERLKKINGQGGSRS